MGERRELVSSFCGSIEDERPRKAGQLTPAAMANVADANKKGTKLGYMVWLRSRRVLECWSKLGISSRDYHSATKLFSYGHQLIAIHLV